ncbi:MAG: hypothetical protein ACPL68_07350, partial [Candidatus Hydrothermia bacterium]
MAWILCGAWQVWSFGRGNITPEALAVDSGGTVHLVYQGGGSLIHSWFEGDSWPSETLGTCTSPPVLRVGKSDKGLHVLAGRNLTYYHRSSTGSVWFKKSLGYISENYDLLVLNNPIIGFCSFYPEKIYRGIGDTLGSFTVTIVDSSYVQYYPPDPPFYYRYTYSVRGPVSVSSSGVVYYSIFTDS